LDPTPEDDVLLTLSHSGTYARGLEQFI
jgi:hypothetical protein